jgi:predicted ATPase/DNA-binding CsgD family transcriptional regulator
VGEAAMPGEDYSVRIGQVPRPISSFVGREAEAATLSRLLDLGDARLITFTGPGGVGKTRLALESVANRKTAGDVPVDVIPLASIRDHRLVIRGIARAIGVPEQPGLSDVESLARGIGDNRRLIVLDNFEQVVDAGPWLAELLARCPRLILVCTSRLRLNIQGESLIPVPPLDLPANDQRDSLDAVRSVPAIALFIQRARQTRPDFDLTHDNCADVIGVCRRLDGLPLAIELAAARLSMLSLGALRSGLDHPFELLAGGTRDNPPRLQSLGDAINWSYELLEPDEQQMLRILSVFLGGWTVEAASAVAGVPIGRAFARIASLNEKSLVRAMSSIDERMPRFTMLETIREFGLEELAREDEVESVRGAHAAYFLAYAESVSPKLDQADQGRWLDLIEADHDNFRLALAWYHVRGDSERGARLAGALLRFWDTRDYLAEGRRWLEAMLALSAPVSDPAPVARATQALAEIMLWQADYAAASEVYGRAMALFQSSSDRLGELRCLRGLALIDISTRELDRAARWIRVADEIARETHDPLARVDNEYARGALLARADNDYMRGALERVLGRHADAEASMLRSFHVREQLGDRSEVLAALGDLAEIATLRGDMQTALQRWNASLELTREVGEVWCFAWYLEGIAHLLVLSHRAELACQLLGAAGSWRTAMNSPVLLFGGTEMKPYHLARNELGAERYDALYQEGAQLTLEAATELAQLYTREIAQPAPSVGPTPDWWEPLGLTAREGEIFLLLRDRLSNKEIGERLFISPRTASTHVASILAKLEVRSRRDIPTVAKRLGV